MQTANVDRLLFVRFLEEKGVAEGLYTKEERKKRRYSQKTRRGEEATIMLTTRREKK